MHKSITLMAIGMMAGASALQAQTRAHHKQSPWGNNPRYAQLREQMLRQVERLESANKTTGTAQRLTATANYFDMGNGLMPYDTTTFKYGGQRGSKFNMMDLSYNTYYDVTPIDQDVFVDFDSSFYSNIPNSSYDTAYNQHNASGKILKTYQSNSYLRNFTLDGQGRAVVAVGQYYDNGSMQWVNDNRTSYSYDAQGRIKADSTEYWDGVSAWEKSGFQSYTYGANNLPTQVLSSSWNGSGYDPSYRVNVSYTAANKFSLFSFETWNGSSYDLEGKDSFAYGAGNALTYHVSRYPIMPGMLVDVQIERRNLNAANLPDSVTYMSLQNPFPPEYDTSYARLTWNSFGNPVTMISRTAGNPTPDNQFNYYYSTYQTTQSVATTPARKSLTVYPNPADNQLNIRPDFTGRYSCNLVNAAGQTVMTTNGSATSGQAISLPLGSLAPGQYWMQLQTADGVPYSATFFKK